MERGESSATYIRTVICYSNNFAIIMLILAVARWVVYQSSPWCHITQRLLDDMNRTESRIPSCFVAVGPAQVKALLGEPSFSHRTNWARDPNSKPTYGKGDDSGYLVNDFPPKILSAVHPHYENGVQTGELGQH